MRPYLRHHFALAALVHFATAALLGIVAGRTWAPTAPASGAYIPDPAAPASPATDAGLTAFTFLDLSTGWIALGTAVLATTDGGQHWQSRGAAPAAVHALDFVSLTEGWAMGEEALFRTLDGGATWEAAGPADGGRLFGMDFVDDRHGWLWAFGGLLRTANGGATWQDTGFRCPAKSGAGVISLVNSTRGWVICGGVGATSMQQKWLYRTDDGGQTWHLVAESPLPNEPRRVAGQVPLYGHVLPARTGLAFLDDANGWLGTSRGGLFTTADGGLSWTRRPVTSGWDEQFVRSVRLVRPGVGFLSLGFGARAALYTSWDDGETWRQLYPAP
jgi:photosystem II stability/assembly factor-like uncharacterized protein